MTTAWLCTRARRPRSSRRRTRPVQMRTAPGAVVPSTPRRGSPPPSRNSSAALDIGRCRRDRPAGWTRPRAFCRRPRTASTHPRRVPPRALWRHVIAAVVWPKRIRQNNSSISARRIAALLKACAARDSVCSLGFACAASRAAARARGLGAASRRPWACRAALTDSARTGQLAGTCNRPWCTASARQDCASRTTSAGTEGDWTDKQSSVASSSSPLHRAQPSRARREGTILRRAGREGQIRDVLSPAGFSSPHETEG